MSTSILREVTKIRLVDELPPIAEADRYAFYIVKAVDKDYAQFYRLNNSRTGWVTLADVGFIGSKLIHIGEEAPHDPEPLIWFNPISNVLCFRHVVGEDVTWVAFLGNGLPGAAAAWLTGSDSPTTSLGTVNDLYLQSDGSVWEKKTGSWVKTDLTLGVETNVRKMVSVRAESELTSLATQSFNNNEVMIVKNLGTYVFVSGSTETANGSTVLTASNGRWIIESYGPSLIRAIIQEEIGSSASPLAMRTMSLEEGTGTETLSVTDVVNTGTAQAASITVANNATTSFYMEVAGAIPGDNIVMTPSVPIDGAVTFSSTITDLNEVRVQITNTSGSSIETPEVWNYAIIKQS